MKITTLQCDACTSEWHLNGFPDWTRPAVVRCPWCGAQQIYPAEPRQHGADLCDDIEAARIKRGYMVRQPGRPVSLDTAAGPFTVYLSPADVQLASIIGQGNVSAGVRLALEDARQRLAAKERNDKISKKLQVALS
jgi:hypothetical protein